LEEGFMRRVFVLAFLAAHCGIVVCLHASDQLGWTNLVEGNTAGIDSVTLTVSSTNESWSATADADWLHVPITDGTGSTNLAFAFDMNPGATRTGTLTIAGTTVTVTQAGATYVPAGLTAPFFLRSAPTTGVAVDGSGNVYVVGGAEGVQQLEEWKGSSNIANDLSSTIDDPSGVAVDADGNVYIAVDYAVEEWNASSGTLTTPVASRSLEYAISVAVDGGGNLYIGVESAIEEWNASSGTLTNLVSSGIDWASGLAVDGNGNLYIGNWGSNTIEEWNASSGTVTTLVSSGLNYPMGVAVDGGGNVYFADYGNSAIKEWIESTDTVTNLVSSGLYNPAAVAVDGAGNIYIGSSFPFIQELPRAFLDPTPQYQGAIAGSGSLPVVVPATVNFRGWSPPTSDQSWLTITDFTNGVVSYSFTANTGSSPRTAFITMLGQQVPIVQYGQQAYSPMLANVAVISNGGFQFSFTNNPGNTFTVLSSTNLNLPLSNWAVVGVVSNISSDQFQFTAPTGTNAVQQFYQVISP
jgi:hypothetical protein